VQFSKKHGIRKKGPAEAGLLNSGRNFVKLVSVTGNCSGAGLYGCTGYSAVMIQPHTVFCRIYTGDVREKRMNSIKEYIRREREEMYLLLMNIPAITVTLFVVSVICMNILANKTLVQYKWIALDGGFLISWMSFMSMDIITKHFGPKAATQMSVVAALINLLMCFIFYIASIIPSNAADYTAFNSIIGGTWFILVGSTIAFLSSAFINNRVNWAIARKFKNNPHGKVAFATASYISTFVGQFIDNLIFAVIVFMYFAPKYWDGFCWTFTQCAVCSVVGALMELLMEVIFSPIGYKVVSNWRRHGVGREYIKKVLGEDI
jgi:hypothetical protein